MLRFAILTAGNIAHHMARTVAAVPGVVEPYAIAARGQTARRRPGRRVRFCQKATAATRN